MNTYIALIVVLVLGYAFLRRFDMYTLWDRSTQKTLILDKNWNVALNTPTRVSGPFNTCSPESYNECAKMAFPNLSRY